MNSRRENEKPFSSGENRTENPPAGSLAVDHVVKNMSETDLTIECLRLQYRIGVLLVEKECK
jgi:hypothetical protein